MPNSDPLISVVIPAYNHERFVGAAVESVLAQSHRDLELLVIDDGSTDRTAEVVQSFDDPRLTYLHQENRDAFNTINRGLRLARGRYVAILNSDDVYHRDRLRRLLEARRRTGAACLFTDVVPIDDRGAVFTDPAFGWNLWHRDNRRFYRRSNDLYTGFLHGNFMVTTSNLFLTAAAVRQVGRFCPLRYLHDYDFIFRVLLAFPGGVHYLENDRLLYYRIHGGNTLGEAAVEGRRQDCQVIRKYLLLRLPPSLRATVGRGLDRRVELERKRLSLRSRAAGGGVSRPRRLLERSLVEMRQRVVDARLREVVASPLHGVLRAGSDRLCRLAVELDHVRRQLAGDAAPPEPPPLLGPGMQRLHRRMRTGIL